MKNNKLKLPALTLLAMGFFLVCTGFFLVVSLSFFAKTPLTPGAGDIDFVVEPGQSLNRIAGNLEQESIISNRTYFKLLAKFKGEANKLQAGEYLLSASKTPEQVLEILAKGKVKLYKITLPEGMNITEIAVSIEGAGFCRKEQFEALCRDRSFILSLDIKSSTLEGYLFPDTYFFPKHTACKTIITTMVDHFKTVFTGPWQARAKTLGFSIHDIVTLASLIEKETGDASERPLISSVFHNRLRKNMRLESDPTVIYGIENFDGNIKKKHLKMITPYNTYQIKGLPLGPIANPGALSIEAALFPAQSDYLFFVSKKDTTHQFSKTMLEHNQAVRKYQLRKR